MKSGWQTRNGVNQLAASATFFFAASAVMASSPESPAKVGPVAGGPVRATGSASVVSVKVPPVTIHKVVPQHSKIWVSWESPREGAGESRPAMLAVVGELKETSQGDLKDGEAFAGWDQMVGAGVLRNVGEATAHLWIVKDGLVSEIALEPNENLYIGSPGVLESTHKCECSCACIINADPASYEAYGITFECPPAVPAPPTIPPPNPWNECVAANGDACTVEVGGVTTHGRNGDCVRAWVPSPPGG